MGHNRISPLGAQSICAQSIMALYTQSDLWLRSLLSIAWADGNFDDSEQQLIRSLVDHSLPDDVALQSFATVTDEELRSVLGQDPAIAENFLRTAVMVAVADGVYSTAEDEILHRFCRVLNTSHDILDTLRLTLCDLPQQTLASLVLEPLVNEEAVKAEPIVPPPGLQAPGLQPPGAKVDPLKSVRVWLDGMDIEDPKVARFLCKLIPPTCPFERDVVLFGKKLAHIPPMCKVNPLYEQLVGLRFRSLSYLADTCKEDISPYL
jgi:tellurite resistance protein